MKVLVIGGTGYIGAGVVRRLRTAGHSPVALVRTAPAGPRSVETRVGDLSAPDTLRAAVTPDIDAVVHAATPTGDWAVDRAAIDVLTESLAGRTLLYLSGVWVLGETSGTATESTPPRPVELVAGRPALEERVLGAAGVRGIVVRPGIVHGHGGGLLAMMVGWAQDAGTGRFVGDPTVRWPMVHVDDLAELVVIALDRAEPGAVLHGVTEPAVPVKELAAAADVAAGCSGGAEAWPETDAARELGAAFAAALALDQEVVSPAARRLGWTPTGRPAVADLLEGSYLVDPVSAV
ncbi:NAD-dependent epimerase/dehydratase family protein [Nocardioides sp. MAHUQ-72]|uniref:NAD-dependent epimerase/dehydratase family protein n=1 Tax=unclassified Nocardioides TaxID=2615069 RepID=UPI00360BCA0F